ncbi:hypothetical protein PWR05_35550 [Paraburkholderia sp. A2RI-6]|uniref:hypothetical protein n=1 Tax=Paraburkholderia sp. A2RI-6 TaxID=3028371 RepID=UPI003B7ABEA7
MKRIEVIGSRDVKKSAMSGRLATDLHRRADQRGQSSDAAGDGRDWIFSRVFLGILNSACQAIRGAEFACRSMESGHVTTAGSCQERILVGFGVALWRTAIRNDDVDVLLEGIFQTATRACNAFIGRRIARTRGGLSGSFSGQAKCGDDLFPRQSGRHRFLHELARDSTNLRP